MTKNNEILPCIYAGDEGDEFCVDCNGITMVVEELNNKQIPATECGGYTAPDLPPEVEEKFEEVEETIEEINEVIEQHDQVVNEPHADNEIQREQVVTPPTHTITPQAVVKEIKAESGVSVELKNKNGSSQWYKFSYTETRVVPEGADIEFEKECLWNDVHNTVDEQVQLTLEALQK